MEEVPQLPIPEKTRNRDGKYQDAARLYIHKRITDLRELLRLCGLPSYEYLLDVKVMDDWEGFAGQLAAMSIQSFWGRPMEVGAWCPDAMNRIMEERERQIKLLPLMVAERDKLLKFMSESDCSTREYGVMAGTLAKLNGEIERWSGWDRFISLWHEAQKAGQRSNVPRGTSERLPSERAAIGTVVDL